MKLYNTPAGIILLANGKAYDVNEGWDELVNRDSLYSYLLALATKSDPIKDFDVQNSSVNVLPPIESQELWAAGVTYLRSREARMEESKQSGGADFYQKVYDADRPELFFKALPHRVVGNGRDVHIRRDSTWNVPEPELTLFINSNGNIQGYTIGNDMSSRSIEGENPLYLPQAKSYEKSAALGPCLWVPETPISPTALVSISILRNSDTVFSGSIQLSQMKRTLPELASWLFRECDFHKGVYLMTGTGIVPPDHFTLAVNDKIVISIEGIGQLENTVAMKK
jgi:2-dehydro-3-deoxy-D-arabinonate dehydratase